MSIAMVLEGAYEVRVAENGQEALEIIMRESVDAVVLDLMMPVLDGEGFLRGLRAAGRVIPVLLASAANNLCDRARQLEVADYLKKPFDVDALEEKLALLTESGAWPRA